MATHTPPRERPNVTVADACDAIHAALAGTARAEILDAFWDADDFAGTCGRLRAAFRSHTFTTSGAPGASVSLKRMVQSFDSRTRRAGLHVLESWDYRAHRFADEITPVLMLDQCALSGVPPERRRNAMAVLLDHYFSALLGLIAAHAWDGEPNENLDRVDRLIAALHSEHGSGRHFADDAETLLLMSISHYHPEESAYDELLAKTDALGGAHRRRLALATAAALGGHLRWGLRFMYRRDIGRMRDDNIVDYPWLVFALTTLMREYAAGAQPGTVEALLNGITADPWFVVGKTTIGNGRDADHAELRELVLSHRERLTHDFAAHLPASTAFTPLGFSCNFLCNTVTAMVATALAANGQRPTVNALFTPREQSEQEARTLMSYAVTTAQSAGGAALIVYDPHDAAHAFNAAIGVLKAR